MALAFRKSSASREGVEHDASDQKGKLSSSQSPPYSIRESGDHGAFPHSDRELKDRGASSHSDRELKDSGTSPSASDSRDRGVSPHSDRESRDRSASPHSDRESRDRGASIRLDDVSKSFGAKTVLSDLDVTIHPGEFVAIVGKSGCGKSTLLRLLAGLEPISGGTLNRDNEPIEGIHPQTRFMFQDARLLPWQSVLENVKVGVAGAGKAEAETRALEALRHVGLEDRAAEWPSVLSGGQRQRVALARALVGNPELLLFDEPLGALDALTRLSMQRLIERLWHNRGFTAVLVTHDVSEAVALADRVILIEEGRIALNVAITLARPRVKDSGFAHFEKLILDRVLTAEERGDSAGREEHFEI